MLPGKSFYNGVNSFMVNAIFSSQRRASDLIRNVGISYFFNKFLIEYCRPMFLSNSFSSFRKHIVHVLFLCSNPKMFRIYAKAIVAFVKHTKTLWNFSLMELVRKSMGGAIVSEIPVSGFRKFSTRPNPAGFSFFNPPEKEKFGRNIRILISHEVILS